MFYKSLLQTFCQLLFSKLFQEFLQALQAYIYLRISLKFYPGISLDSLLGIPSENLPGIFLKILLPGISAGFFRDYFRNTSYNPFRNSSYNSFRNSSYNFFRNFSRNYNRCSSTDPLMGSFKNLSRNYHMNVSRILFGIFSRSS